MKDGVARIPLLYVEDEADLQLVVGQMFDAHFSGFFEVVSVSSVDEVLRQLREGRYAVVLSDLNIEGGTSPLSEIVAHLRQRARGVLLVTSGEGRFELREPLPEHVRVQAFQKPFRLKEISSALKQAVQFLQEVDLADDVSSTPVVESPVREGQSDFFAYPEEGFSSFASLMQALPGDPQCVDVSGVDRSRILMLLAEGLSMLSEALESAVDSEDFSGRSRLIFPLEKRESLLKLLGPAFPAAFVLDIAWHDVNNALGALTHTPEAWAGVRTHLRNILNPALHAFSRYSESSDPHVFLERTTFQPEMLPQGFRVIETEGLNGSEVLELPRGGLRSIVDTFLSNAKKVAFHHDREDYQLGLSVRRCADSSGAGYLEFSVWDDLPGFPMDQLLYLFDRRLKKSAGWGMGTGLQRLGDIVHASWSGAPSGLPFTMAFSQHDPEAGESAFYFKQRSENLVLSPSADLRFSMPKVHRSSARKVFVFRLPLHASK